jgi:spermidine/putrescine transport system permease protein
LVFLPALTTVAVPQFLDNSNSGSMIGDIIVAEGSIAGTSEIALARVSSLSMTLLIVLTIGFLVVFYGRKILINIRQNINNKHMNEIKKNVKNNEK